MPAPATIAGIALIALSLCGSGYTLFAAAAVARFRRQPLATSAPAEPVSLLKPLHGAEPRLRQNLATLLDQDWPAPIELVAGVSDPRDAAAQAIEALTIGERRSVRLVADPTRHGANAKICNLVNMMPAAHHDLLVLSDSDIAVPHDYLARVVAALASPGVGAVTCLYRGRGDAGFWSTIGAAGISYGFLPNAVASLALGDRRLCMGSTIALRRETLGALGGFAAFVDILADDHAIGAAVRARGGTVAIPNLLLVHASAEPSLRALLRHELRWAATVRGVVPLPTYLGLALTQPLSPALLACLFLPAQGVATLGAAIATRVLLWTAVDRWGGRTAPLYLLPMRDLVSTAVFLASLFARSVDWRGERLTMLSKGRVARRPEPRS